MATISMTQPMDTSQFIFGSPLSITFVSTNGASAAVNFGTDLQLVFQGSGLAFAGNEPNGGSVNRIIATRIEGGVTVNLGELVTGNPWLFTRDGLAQAFANEGQFQTDSAGYDIMRGSEFIDTIVTRQSEDRIIANGGDDVIRLETTLRAVRVDALEIFGGTGNDTLQVKGTFAAQVDIRDVNLTSVEILELDDGLPLIMGQAQAEQFDRIFTGGGSVDIYVFQERAVLDLNDVAYDRVDNTRLFGMGREAGDRIIGDARLSSWLYGAGGGDTLSGGRASDVLYGQTGSDVLTGGNAADGLYGDTGRDTLNGGRGADTLVGGAGRDVFVFGSRSGPDTVTDCDARGAVHDVIDLRGVAEVTGFRDLMRNHFNDGGANSGFDFGGGNTILLIGVTRADLDPGDFLFRN